MIDRTQADLSSAAQRRVFHSKVDTIRPTYGFEDVSLAPGTDTVETDRRRPDPDVRRPGPRDPDPRVRDGRRRRPGLRRRARTAGRSRDPQPRGRPDALRRARTSCSAGSPRRPMPRSRPFSPRRTCSPSVRTSSPAASTRSTPQARRAAVAATPGAARKFGPFCAEHGADLFLVQSQVSSARHLATDYDPLSLEDFTRYMPIPVAVGNTTNAEAAFALMEQGAAAVFVGVGPGAACTTREVLGIGVPAGHRDQRCRGGPRGLLRRDRPVRARSSRTAACAAVASWRRPSPRAQTR